MGKDLNPLPYTQARAVKEADGKVRMSILFPDLVHQARLGRY